MSAVPGVHEGVARALTALGAGNVGRLVAYLPMRHELIEAESEIGGLVPGRISSTRGEVTSSKVSPRGRRPRVEVVLHDGTGRLEVTWFNMLFLREKMRPGARVWVQGKVERRGAGLVMVNPRQEVLDPAREDPPPREARVRAVYPAGEAVRSWQIEQAVSAVLPRALPLIEDHLDTAYRSERGLVSLGEAYRMMHRPASGDEVREGRRRLAYDELLFLQLAVHLKRARLREGQRAPALPWDERVDRSIRAVFPFGLTPGQEGVIREIAGDLSRATPTNRLILGDVGSGKTVVALYGMLMAAKAGHQAALMAPTEILAEQHHRTISGMLRGSGVRVSLLTGSVGEAERAGVLSGLANGAIDLVVGTHALLTEDVRFASLAVAVIDEQHRFGVHQRGRLRAKAGDETTTPHVLVMTATPIPRTLAITLFGDLDISVIGGMPPGRSPVRTVVVRDNEREGVYREIRREVERGARAFVVVPVIGEDEDAGRLVTEGGEPEGDEGLRGVRSVMKELEEGVLKGISLGSLHGRMARAARDATMERFRSGSVRVLVSTTVVEVGVDVPEATVMVVEHAERFGLAQLHQLRGRVGRGIGASACYLIAGGDALTATGWERLRVMETCSDGFALAEKDFEIRGPGEVFGTKQSGLPPFKIADLMADRELLAMARRDASAWLRVSPGLSRSSDVLVKRRLMKAYGEALGLGDVG